MNWNSEENNEKDSSLDALQHQIMEKCVSIVVIKLQRALPGILKEWITENLTDKNVAEISSLYDKTLNVHVQENKAIVEPRFLQEFHKLCEKESHESCRVPLEKVSEACQKFNGTIIEAFRGVVCFLDENELDIIGKNRMKALSKNKDTAFVLPATKLIFEKLIKIYNKQNKSIIETCVVKLQTVSNSLKRLYSEEMEGHIKNEPRCQSLLSKFHSAVQEKCLVVFEQYFADAKENLGKMREVGKEKLRQQLEVEFVRFQSENSARFSDWISLTERKLEEGAANCKAEIEDFRKSTSDKLTRSHIIHIGQIAAKCKKLADLQCKLLMNVENPRQSSNTCTDCIDLLSSFVKTWIDKICGGQLSEESHKRKIDEALLKMYQDEMLEAAKNNDRQKLTNLHNALMEECLMFCDTILPPGGSTEELKNSLDSFFKNVLALDDQYSQYVKRMSDVNSTGVESNSLLKHHNELKTELKKLLEIEIRKRLGENNTDCFQQQISLLETRMDEQFQTFQTKMYHQVGDYRSRYRV